MGPMSTGPWSPSTRCARATESRSARPSSSSGAARREELVRVTELLTGPLGKVVLLGSMYLLLAVVVWMEARELAHATTRRISPVAPVRGRRIPVKLVLVEGVGPQTVDLVPPETLVGRDASCHLTIPDSSVSHRHARIYHSD